MTNTLGRPAPRRPSGRRAQEAAREQVVAASGTTVINSIVAGHGPTLFAGLRERLELNLVERQEFRSGAVALRYQPSRVAD